MTSQLSNTVVPLKASGIFQNIKDAIIFTDKRDVLFRQIIQNLVKVNLLVMSNDEQDALVVGLIAQSKLDPVDAKWAAGHIEPITNMLAAALTYFYRHKLWKKTYDTMAGNLVTFVLGEVLTKDATITQMMDMIAFWWSLKVAAHFHHRQIKHGDAFLICPVCCEYCGSLTPKGFQSLENLATPIWIGAVGNKLITGQSPLDLDGVCIVHTQCYEAGLVSPAKGRHPCEWIIADMYGANFCHSARVRANKLIVGTAWPLHWPAMLCVRNTLRTFRPICTYRPWFGLNLSQVSAQWFENEYNVADYENYCNIAEDRWCAQAAIRHFDDYPNHAPSEGISPAEYELTIDSSTDDDTDHSDPDPPKLPKFVYKKKQLVVEEKEVLAGISSEDESDDKVEGVPPLPPEVDKSVAGKIKKRLARAMARSEVAPKLRKTLKESQATAQTFLADMNKSFQALKGKVPDIPDSFYAVPKGVFNSASTSVEELLKEHPDLLRNLGIGAAVTLGTVAAGLIAWRVTVAYLDGMPKEEAAGFKKQPNLFFKLLHDVGVEVIAASAALSLLGGIIDVAEVTEAVKNIGALRSLFNILVPGSQIKFPTHLTELVAYDEETREMIHAIETGSVYPEIIHELRIECYNEADVKVEPEDANYVYIRPKHIMYSPETLMEKHRKISIGGYTKVAATILVMGAAITAGAYFAYYQFKEAAVKKDNVVKSRVNNNPELEKCDKCLALVDDIQAHLDVCPDIGMDAYVDFKTYSCKVCPAFFKEEIQLDDHIHDVHFATGHDCRDVSTDPNGDKVEEVGWRIDTANLIHFDDIPFKNNDHCVLCFRYPDHKYVSGEKVFNKTSPGAMLNHYRVIHSDGWSHCDDCERKFDNRANCLAHVLTKHVEVFDGVPTVEGRKAGYRKVGARNRGKGKDAQAKDKASKGLRRDLKSDATDARSKHMAGKGATVAGGMTKRYGRGGAPLADMHAHRHQDWRTVVIRRPKIPRPPPKFDTDIYQAVKVTLTPTFAIWDAKSYDEAMVLVNLALSGLKKDRSQNADCMRSMLHRYQYSRFKHHLAALSLGMKQNDRDMVRQFLIDPRSDDVKKTDPAYAVLHMVGGEIPWSDEVTIVGFGPRNERTGENRLMKEPFYAEWTYEYNGLAADIHPIIAALDFFYWGTEHTSWVTARGHARLNRDRYPHEKKKLPPLPIGDRDNRVAELKPLWPADCQWTMPDDPTHRCGYLILSQEDFVRHSRDDHPMSTTAKVQLGLTTVAGLGLGALAIYGGAHLGPKIATTVMNRTRRRSKSVEQVAFEKTFAENVRTGVLHSTKLYVDSENLKQRLENPASKIYTDLSTIKIPPKSDQTEPQIQLGQAVELPPLATSGTLKKSGSDTPTIVTLVATTTEVVPNFTNI
jgi:hypothetical protein